MTTSSVGSLLLLLALGCTLAGVGLLYLSWKRRWRFGGWTVAAGWFALLLAACLWTARDGWEFGVTYAFTVPSLAAACILLLGVDRRRAIPRLPPRARLSAPSRGALLRSLLAFALVVPFGIGASVLVASGIGLLLPVGELDRMVFIVCVAPVLWGVVSWWLSADPRRMRPVLSLVALSLLGLLSIATHRVP